MPSDTTTRIAGGKVEDAAKGTASAGPMSTTSQDRGAGSSRESGSPGSHSGRSDVSRSVPAHRASDVPSRSVPAHRSAGGGDSPGTPSRSTSTGPPVTPSRSRK